MNNELAQPLSTAIYTSDLLRIGRFRCPVGHPRFTDSGPIVSGHLIVFPRTTVRITHPHDLPIVASPNLVMFYNLHQCYRRERLSTAGDYCDWFAFAPDHLLKALYPYEPTVVERPNQPFQLTHAPSAPAIYLRQRLVVEHIMHTPLPDQLFVEETMLWLLDTLLRHIYSTRRRYATRISPRSQAQQRELVSAVQITIADHYTEKLTITDLAATVYLSPYELCRIFRTYTGCSIHSYLNQLRLCVALDLLANPRANLTEVALALGYNSHSHFTSAFRHTFGVAPSLLRRPDKALQKLRKNLIV